MYLLAVSLAASLLFSGETQADRLTDHEKAIWNQLRPSVVTLYDNDRPTGAAALIDDTGYFVTHISSLNGDSISGRSATGKSVNFTVIDRDKITQLALLKTTNWTPGPARPFRLPHEEEKDGHSILAILPSGPIRAVYISKHQPGLLRSSRRLVTLTEIRFEAPSQMVGGALIVSEHGQLIGALNATLDRSDNITNNLVGNQSGQQAQSGIQNTLSNNGGRTGQAIGPGVYLDQGPGEMTVAYTVGPEIVNHTLQGFLSPKHAAEYAALGIFCTNAIGGGALIQRVTPGSPAQQARLQPGDILMNINFHEIADQVAFATVMLGQDVGKPIQIIVKRGPRSMFVEVTPAKAID